MLAKVSGISYGSTLSSSKDAHIFLKQNNCYYYKIVNKRTAGLEPAIRGIYSSQR